MTTLIAVYNSEGCIGRCDARCYDAHDEPCDCICAGWNHSAGLEQATDNTRELTELWVEQARAAGQDITRTELAGRSYCPGGAVRAGCTQWDFVSANTGKLIAGIGTAPSRPAGRLRSRSAS